MNTIIEKIRAEIEHRRDLNYKYHIKQGFGSSAGQRYDEDVKILSIISGFENSEKPTTAEGLEEEIYNYANTIAEGTPLFEIIPQTARHFAQWQKEKDNEVADKALTTSIKLQEGWYAKGIADGEKSMKEQMMKEAVEGVVEDVGVNYIDLIDFDAEKLGLIDGDKVRIIIVKED